MKIEDLIKNPELILKDDLDFQRIIDEIPRFINPLINSKCALDEIYTDGLDANQIWPQVQMVLDSAEDSLREEIDLLGPGTKSVTGEEISEESEEEEEEEEAFGDQFDQGSDDEELEDEEEEGEEEENALSVDEDDLEENELDDEDLENDDQEEDVNEDEDEDADIEENQDYDLKPKKDKYGLNDDFFDLESYQRQVLALEDKDALDDDEDYGEDGEDIDLFADMEDEDDEDDEMYTYNDFFKEQVDSKPLNQKKGKNVKFAKKVKAKDFNEGDFNDAYESAMADMMGDEEEIEEPQKEEKEENLSTFEKQQRALQKEIDQLEKESIAEKKWTMKGEVTAKQRDSESALVEDLEFDRNAKPVPVITQEVTKTLEDIIRRRIRNDQFDDIPKRIISELTNFKPSQKIDIDERQSKKSLAEIYEDEYNNKADNNNKVSEELKAAHDEITVLWDKVNWELDSLYSAHFIPKPKQKLLDVKVQTSTVTLEDAQPLTMGDTQRLAPQEIYKANTKVGKDEVQLRSGVVMAKAELEREDKARLRRAKKRKQHNQDKDESIKKKKVSAEQL